MLDSIYGVQPQALISFLGESFPAYRSKQLLQWIYRKLIFDPAQMSDLPADFKEYLRSAFDFTMPQVAQQQKSADGSVKLRLTLADAQGIEMVLMPEDKKLTLCVSSQVGCARACNFCATGSMGLHRNLGTHEIVQQILLALQISSQPITNLVFMGMGEPMDNLDNVLDTIRLIQSEHTLTFSPRRTTVSTCGIIPGIMQLADSRVKTKLAVSLNSASDEIRSSLMPINIKYPLDILKKALLYYQKRSQFRITLEYIMIPGINMSALDIKKLTKFCGDLSCKLNFIPYNENPALPYHSPTSEDIEYFMKAAQSIPQAITLRRSRGSDILGACGQLVVNDEKSNRRLE